ncbi:Ig-like domain-containing protein [Clostridium bowmanii]|uniref:DUF5057 domain-containing protein n=1 Tax=Clostridium bowmanii TaxID=132925 RepID=UPI001C0D8F88|nr:Ig-like domain-containing protein [Clostridium bowmanii]MBU3189515.1 hypothetical protein [Clostridium bowmanii]MCA1074130.1 Ig-like domain-containing protein [Clostridium bowmanii]
MNVKRIVCVMLIFTFVFLNFQGMVNTKTTYAATSLASNVSILEITDSGASNLTTLTSTEIQKITTMSMKQFVANRNQIEGLYDIIYIGTGTYATGAIINKNHNTKNILNDITNLKANEIINNFINKDYLLILHNDVFKGTILNSKFSSYKNNTKTNVKVVTDTNSVITLMRNYTPNKPVLNIRNYTNGETYNAGNPFILNYDVTSASSNINLKLYLDGNYNNINEPSEVVATKSSTSGYISYIFPRGLSGIRNWTLESIDSSGKKDIQSGYIKFNDQKVIVNVLQVTSSGTIGSLLNNSNMTQSFLNGTDYQIKIEVVDMNTFNSSKYKEINGKYDMILFGFADTYGNARLGIEAKVELDKFIATNQSVMFTHDILFASSPTWSSYAGAFGQKTPYTDLGNGAPNKTTSTKKINEGLMTMYPYVLDDTITIATTHNQYYTLNLEDKDVIPWYNLTGSDRDPYDSYNHFYTYSKGNLTYSGTGHTSSGFPVSEQKLFVNTMYRAFLGANHNPIITVISPKTTDIVSQNKKVFVEALIEDLDLGDSSIGVKIYIEDREVYNGNVINGTTIKNTFDNYTVVGDTVTVKIVATDSRGAESIQTINLTYKDIKVPTGLDLTDSSDSGVLNNDNLTNDITPTITGEAEANSAVTLYNGNISIGTGIADANGKFSITTNELTPDGVYNITAKAKDRYENESPASSPLAIIIDKTPPNAPRDLDLIESSDTGDSSTDNITSDNTPTINGKAEPGSTVTLYNGNIVLNTGITDASGNFSITISSELADAVYTITAEAKDMAGNISSRSAGLIITIDSMVKAPTDLDLAAASDTGISNTDNITSDNTPTINGKANPDNTVTLYDKDGNLIGTGKATVDGNFSITITDADKLNDGVNNITAKSKDIAGNISGVSVGLSITIDTVVPSTPTLRANITTQTKENVSITIIYPNDAAIKDYKIGISGKWLNYTGAVVVDTNDTIYAQCKDLAGNISEQGSLEIRNIDKTKIKTGLFVNNKFTEIVGDINIVKGFNTNLAFEIKDLKNQEITLNMNSTNFITISEVKVYSITDLITPIKTLYIIGNAFTIKGLPMDKTDYVLVLKSTARNLGTNISDFIKINGFERIEKHIINVVKLPSLQ